MTTIKTKKRHAQNSASEVTKKKSKKISDNEENSKESNQNQKTSKKVGKSTHIDKKIGNKKSFAGKDGKFNKMKQKTENMKPEDWAEFKKKKKELRLVRKKKKNENLYELCLQAKKLGEKLRRKTLEGGDTERNALCEKIHKLLKDGTDNKSTYSQLVLAHDMTRVVQIMLKFSNPKIKEEILKDLLSCIVPMLQSSYGRFCVNKMFKYGSTSIRHSIIDSFYGNAVKLTAHSLSSAVVDQAYVTWATSAQKKKLKQEFYGDIYRNNKDDAISTLADTYKNSQHMKNAMLSATKANLLKVINKQQFDNSLFHAVLYEFLLECSTDDRTEFVSLLSPSIATICSTKEGTRSGMICLWQSTNKDKKVILRNIKEHILKLAQHEHGHIFLLAILSSVDDTVLLNKMLVNELVFNSSTLVQNEWGRKVLLWLVAPGEKTYFHPELIKELNEGVKNSTCKKSAEIRAEEILVNCKEPLCAAISQNSADWLKSGAVALATVAILKSGCGESLRMALESLAEVIVSTNWKVDNEVSDKIKGSNAKTQKETKEKDTDEPILGIEHAGLHMSLKKLAQFDKTQIEKGNPTFGEAIANKLKKKVLKQWLTLNRACFFLLTIIENCDSAKQALIDLLASSKETLQKQTHVGAQLLLKKI